MMQTLYPEWKELVEKTKACDYGAFFSHEDLATILQMKRTHPRYMSQIQKWKKGLLEDHRRCAQVVQGKGYRIVEPKEHHGVMRAWGKKAGKRIRKAVKVGLATPQERLTPEENLHLSNALAKFGSLKANYEEALRDTRPSLPPSKLPDRPKMIAS